MEADLPQLVSLGLRPPKADENRRTVRMTAGSGEIRELRSLGYRVELISPAPSA
jgi:hypothetical protein